MTESEYWHNWWRGELTEDEWQELVAREYVLTHYPTHPYADEKRYQELSRRTGAYAYLNKQQTPTP